MFHEYLGSTGTTAAAMVIKDLVMEEKFKNDRDAGRVLTSVAYHIRRPNTQLVKEYESLLNWASAKRFVRMAIPLSFGHLVQMTCKRAGNTGGAEQTECWQNFASKYVKMFYDKFKSASSREDKQIYLNAMSNIRHGGQAEIVKELVYGETNEDPEFRASGIWVAGN